MDHAVLGKQLLHPWDLLPDYDNNAQQLLTNVWRGTANVVVDAPIDRGTMQATSSLKSIFLVAPISPEDKLHFPECSYLSNNGTLFGYDLYQSTVHFFRLDAHVVEPTATATSTPTSTPAAPTATTIPSPEAACSSTVSRELTAYYGVLRDDKGKLITNNLALSDHIPAALSDAIRRATSPGKVKQLINHWIDTGLIEEDWGSASGDNIDPAADLAQQYGAQTTDLQLGDLQDLGSETYTFQTYILRDSHDVPPGCILPADYDSAALGLLIPIEQTTSVTIHYLGQDAVAQGAVLPTATSTETSAPTAPATEEPTSTATSPDPSATPTPTDSPATEAPATTTPPTPVATTGPDPSATVAVSQLPNTGAHPASHSTSNYWFLLVLLAALTFCLTLTRRRRI